MSEEVKRYLEELKTIKEKELKGNIEAIELIKQVYHDVELADAKTKTVYYKAITRKENLKRDIQNLETIIKNN